MLPDIFWAAPVKIGEAEAEAEAVAEELPQEPLIDFEGVGIVLPPIPIAAIPLGVPIAVFFPTYQYKQHQPCKQGTRNDRTKKVKRRR